MKIYMIYFDDDDVPQKSVYQSGSNLSAEDYIKQQHEQHGKICWGIYPTAKARNTAYEIIVKALKGDV